MSTRPAFGTALTL